MSEWVQYVDEASGHPYYFNSQTGESKWANEHQLPTTGVVRYDISDDSDVGDTLLTNTARSHSNYITARSSSSGSGRNVSIGDNYNTARSSSSGSSGRNVSVGDNYNTARSSSSGSSGRNVSVDGYLGDSGGNKHVERRPVYLPGNPYATTGVGSRNDISDDSDQDMRRTLVNSDSANENSDDHDDDSDEDDDDDDEDSDDDDDDDDDDEEEDETDDEDDDSDSIDDDSGADIEASYVDNEGGQEIDDPHSHQTHRINNRNHYDRVPDPRERNRNSNIRPSPRNKDDETFSPLLEEAFQDFLESPEGKEALKMEQTKVQKMFEKQQKREQKQYQRQQKYLAAKLKKDKRKLPAGPPTWISWAGTTFTSIYNPSAGNYHPPPILFLLIHEQIPNCDIMLILPHLPSFHPNFTRDVSRLIPIFVQNWLRLC